MRSYLIALLTICGVEMADTKHTPGPWSVPHFAKPDVNCNCKYVLSDDHMGAVASVHCSGEGSDWEKHGDNPRFEEAVANAHLIAAAPDLLEALKEAANSSGFQYMMFETRERINDAIAKAEGNI